jgi:hypothetical protein
MIFDSVAHIARAERRYPVAAYDKGRQPIPGRHALDAAAGDIPLSPFAQRCIAANRADPERHLRNLVRFFGPQFAADCADADTDGGFAAAYDSAFGIHQEEPKTTFLERHPYAAHITCM